MGEIHRSAGRLTQGTLSVPAGKICYVLPEYRKDDHTHFSYLLGFVRALAERADIFLVIGRGEVPEDIGKIKRVCLAGEIFSLCVCILKARLSGCRRFYVHYSFSAAFVSSVIARLSGAKVFYWNCGLPWLYRRPIMREFFERLVYRMVSYLVTGTEGMKLLYAAHYPIRLERILVMPNWIDSSVSMNNSQFSDGDLKKILGIPGTAKTILFVHRLSRRKGAYYIPELAAQAAARGAFLVVAGDGPDRGAVELSVRERGFQKNVKFLGWIGRKDIERYYAIADCFIMPSEEEGFPHVLLEAMAYGVPFVAFGVGGVPEIVPPESKRFVVKPGDISLFKERLLQVLDLGQSERKALAEVFRAWIRRFDLDKAVDRFIEITGS